MRQHIYLGMLLWLALGVITPSDAVPMDHEVGYGFGETTAYGLFYQQRISGPWQARLAVGGFPVPLLGWFAGGGALVHDLPESWSGRPYLVLAGLVKDAYDYDGTEKHLSLIPAVGARWGAMRVELGVAVFSTERRTAWGWAIAPTFGSAFSW